MLKKYLLLAAVSAAVAVSAENLVRNGDLTQGAKGWSFSAWTKSPGGLKLGEENGKKFRTLFNPGDTRFSTMCVQQVRLEPDTEYRYRFSMRTKDVKRHTQGKVNHGAGISITCGRDLFSGTSQRWFNIEGTSGWTVYQGQFNTGKIGSKPVSLYLSLTMCSGAADFSDISIEKVK